MSKQVEDLKLLLKCKKNCFLKKKKYIMINLKVYLEAYNCLGKLTLETIRYLRWFGLIDSLDISILNNLRSELN